MRENISAVIITKNEKSNIERCLKSVQWADEIIVLDNNSSDNTAQLAKNMGANIHINPKWQGFGLAKKLAVSKAKHKWIFSIDADEEVTPELKNEILKTLENPEYMIYNVKRKSFYLGKLINYCGWNKDYPKRLFNRNFADFNEKNVHESVVSESELGTIQSPLMHYTYPTIASHIDKINNYTNLSATNNKKSSLCLSIFSGLLKFIKMYFFQLGILDGKHGFILSLLSSFGVTIKYLKIYEKKMNG